MNTPICDFVNNYKNSNTIRAHMPGHKGVNFLGYEADDITEIKGADSLFECDGIIQDSEQNATQIFGAKSTVYSTEGSSLCIRAMLFLAVKYALLLKRKPLILAAKNAHKTFITTSATLDFPFEWLPQIDNGSYLESKICVEKLDSLLKEKQPIAVFITSPDYLGNIADIEAISKICKKNDCLLIVDNAHGAYLKFLSPSHHPIDLGADLCCDSAHKTLPSLTGGAYLHISKTAPDFFCENVKSAMSIFASTSPSYLILQSLDRLNLYLTSGYSKKISAYIKRIETAKLQLIEKGFVIVSNEPLKITIATKSYGYLGTDFAEKLRENGVECEFCDNDFVVLMLSVENGDDIDKITEVILNIKQLSPITSTILTQSERIRKLTPKQVLFLPSEKVQVIKAKGRICASINIACPPAVPIVSAGEIIDTAAIEQFLYYGIEYCDCVIE